MSRSAGRSGEDRRQFDLFSGVATSGRNEGPCDGGSTAAGASFKATPHFPTRSDQASAEYLPEAKPVIPILIQKQRAERSYIPERPVWKSDRQVRTVAVKDLPNYPPELIASVRRTIKEAPTDRVLLTYKEINAFFGVSRATVARRLKDGKVPGIRLLHGRVLEDGSVRRLDQTQLLYLLLSVRSGRTC